MRLEAKLVDSDVTEPGPSMITGIGVKHPYLAMLEGGVRMLIVMEDAGDPLSDLIQ
jgi:hypothetical protein